MSRKAVAWSLAAAVAVWAVLLFNYWASFQPLSTIAYSGIVLALLGLANLARPFRFLGIRRRAAGALIFLGGLAVAFAALLWPAPVIRAAQHRTSLDDVMPEYQFFERHSLRVHARPEQAIEAVRQSTFGDMTSLNMLLRIRGAALRQPYRASGFFAPDKRILDAFSASGYVFGGAGHEIVMCFAANMRLRERPRLRTLSECAEYRQQGAIKMAFNFTAEDAGGGWTLLSTETRVLALDEATRRGMARYWRLIVPGSGMLRREWLAGIRRRAEAPSL